MTPAATDARGGSWAISGVVAGAIVLVLGWLSGLILNVLVLGLYARVAVGIVRRCVAVIRRRLRVDWLRRPLAREHRAQLVRCLVNWAFIAVVGAVVWVAMVPVQLGDDHAAARVLLSSCIVAAALLELVPMAPPRRASTIIVGLAIVFLGVQLLMIFREPDADAVVLEPPMAEELLVFHGGQSPLINHHYVVGSQRHAVDLVVVADGRITTKGGTGNQASACYGKAVLAPAAGRVVRASDGLADMPPGEGDRSHLVGNHVVIEIGPHRYVLLAHLRSGSVRVKVGDQVACGQQLAECGNSGNSSEAHVHIQVQDGPELDDDVTTYPILFRHVVRGGVAATAPIAVRRNDHVGPSAACGR